MVHILGLSCEIEECLLLNGGVKFMENTCLVSRWFTYGVTKLHSDPYDYLGVEVSGNELWDTCFSVFSFGLVCHVL